MNGHVFVSHGSDDRVQANELAAFIEAKGAKAWIAPRNVRPGQDYSEQLQEAIENCSAFLVLVTDKANKSPYVRAEVEMAFSLFKPIFPVRMADIKPAAGLALFLKIRHWTDAFGEDKE
ncbi:toll/interleukin-1 receptor domain-containing protein, partial [Sphingosinicella sp.]|uniref:toll/interleukin-1 receptor domain-containing protein n=1 Tax=Sphingosinicella sp. TaxID=1917971 RepID=UPI0040383479